MGFGLLEDQLGKGKSNRQKSGADNLLLSPPFPDLPSTDIGDNNNFLPSQLSSRNTRLYSKYQGVIFCCILNLFKTRMMSNTTFQYSDDGSWTVRIHVDVFNCHKMMDTLDKYIEYNVLQSGSEARNIQVRKLLASRLKELCLLQDYSVLFSIKCIRMY